MWRAHGLPRLEQLSADQVDLVHDWLDWMLHEGEGWPTPERVDLPVPGRPPAGVDVPASPPDSVLHARGGEVGGYGIPYERSLRHTESCPDCGECPSLVSLSVAERSLRAMYGPDAVWFGRALARRLDEERVVA